MGKKNVHKLSPELEPTYSLLGISSHENDYRISWALNEHVGMHFAKTDNHNFLHPKFAETLVFTQYVYVDDADYRTFRLVSNRCDNGFLLDEYKNIDFWLLFDTFEKPQLQTLVTKIRAIQFVSAVFSMDLEKLKNKNRLF